MAQPSKADKVKAMFDKAISDGDQAKAEGIVAAAMIYEPGIDFKKRNRKTDASAVDFAERVEDADYAEFERRLDAS